MAMLVTFRAGIPFPFGTTRLGLAVVHMLRAAGLHSRAREVVQDLLEFARTHEERMSDPLLNALAST